MLLYLNEICLNHDIISFYSSADNVRVYNLEGSLFKWANEGRPMVDSNGQPVTKVHPYNAVFGKFLNKELRASPSDGKL